MQVKQALILDVNFLFVPEASDVISEEVCMCVCVCVCVRG